MLGFVLNTHQQWLCRQLSDAGYSVTRQIAIEDSGPAIQQAVRESLSRADFIIVTGGLGPTSDDITRDLIASLLGKRLHKNAAIAAKLEAFFAQRNRPMPANTLLQAMVPEDALILDNAHGTAPGLAMEVTPNPFRPDGKTSWLVMLPGPPRELKPMFATHALPLLQKHFPLESAYSCLTLRTTGIGESQVEDEISGLLQPLVDDGLIIGYCAHYGWVDVRLVARGHNAEQLVKEGEQMVRSKLHQYIYGTQDEQLHEVIVRLLTERKQTIVTAESCTGGFIANRLTDVSGASAVFLGGVVTYSNEAKQNLLGVKAETLATHGAVSEPVVREMAEGARKRLGADFAIATTGIAGPTGGTPTKPVGTVFIALATPSHTFVINPTNRYDRPTFKIITCQQALELLRRNLLHTSS
ncbi:competence/damage-inducible protein CinA [Pedosphaera parvula Ellin514]|uniref:CinA-like protein n=2 Tax=Pedosphaera TaxID=1032526 RepID=B9XHJ1_PEDPL|nr:competence/damage-inducible protein CinA [Pedosphaera parvula Ellin514]